MAIKEELEYDNKKEFEYDIEEKLLKYNNNVEVSPHFHTFLHTDSPSFH